MSKKYEEIMDRITVTEEMRERILQNVRGADTAPASVAVRFPYLLRYAAAAACFALFIVCTIAVPRILQQSQNNVSPGGDIQGVPDTAEYQSVQELSKQLGFQISGIDTLPFKAADTRYLSYYGEIGEIEYTGSDGQTATFRKSKGTDDNSGDYSSYDVTRELTAGSVTATVKGDGAKFSLACWTDGTYAYSVSLSEGVSIDRWKTIIEGTH